MRVRASFDGAAILYWTIAGGLAAILTGISYFMASPEVAPGTSRESGSHLSPPEGVNAADAAVPSEDSEVFVEFESVEFEAYEP